MNKTITELERCLLDNIPDILMVIDKQHCIQHINQTLPQYSQQDVIGSSVFDYIPPHQHSVIRNALIEVEETNKTVQFSLIGEGEAGQSANYHSRAAPLRDNNTIIGYTIITTDVTKQNKAEEHAHKMKLQLLEYTKLLSAAQLSNSFAHDLNQPLSAIMNYANGSLRKLDQEDIPVESIKQAQQKIAELADYASNIVTNVRNFLREDSGNITTLSLEKVLHKIFDLLQLNTQHPDIELRNINVSDITLQFDEINLIQIILNVLLNSIESLISSKTQNPRISIRCNTDANNLTIHISDNGPGVPEEFEQKIFQPMHSTKSTGLGIGLGICHHILELYKGNIYYHRNADAEPTFSIEIPICASITLTGNQLEKKI